MGLIDRYLLGRLVWPFLFFLLALTGVMWLAQSLRVVDVVLNNGQSALVLLELAVLLVPRALAVVIPVAALAASLYAVERAMSDSEIAALFASGASRLRAARAVFVFGGLVAILLYVNALWLSPGAAQAMRSRTAEVQADLAAALLQDGRFMHPASGLTLYLREVGDGGEARGVFVHDSRDAEAPVSYHAQRGVLTKTPQGPLLVMFEGAAQRLDAKSGAYSYLRFDKLAYDLSAYLGGGGQGALRPSERPAWELLSPPANLSPRERGRWLAEAHDQLSSPLYGFALPAMAAAGLLAGGFSRRGYGGRVLLAGGAAVAARVAGVAAKNLTASHPELWALLYAPPLIGLVGAAALLAWGGIGLPRFRRARREAPS